MTDGRTDGGQTMDTHATMLPLLTWSGRAKNTALYRNCCTVDSQCYIPGWVVSIIVVPEAYFLDGSQGLWSPD